MIDFYKKLLGRDPEAASENMAIFMSGDTKIFIHRTYQAKEANCLPKTITPTRWRMWTLPVANWSPPACASR